MSAFGGFGRTEQLTSTVKAGNDVTLVAANDATFTAAQLGAGRNASLGAGSNDVTLAAQQTLNLEAAANSQANSSFKQTTKSGLFSNGGFSVTLGSRNQKATDDGSGTTHTGSTVGQRAGRRHDVAGEAYRQLGSSVAAPTGDVSITAPRIDIGAVYDTAQRRQTFETKQSGLTLSVTNPVVSAAQTADYGLANFLGYTNGQETYAALLASRGDQATTSLGHSRGTLVQESAFTILNNRSDENGNTYTNSNLTVRGVGSAANAESFSAAAAAVQGPKGDREQVTFSYFSNDPVAVAAGGNKGTWTLSDLWQVIDTNNSAHSCYGSGAVGCAQVERPVPNGPQGTPEGNARLIRYVGGQQVDANGPIQKAK